MGAVNTALLWIYSPVCSTVESSQPLPCLCLALMFSGVCWGVCVLIWQSSHPSRAHSCLLDERAEMECWALEAQRCHGRWQPTLDCLKLPKTLSQGSTHAPFMRVGSASQALSKEELPSVGYSEEKWLLKNDCAKKQIFIIPRRGHSIIKFFASLCSDRAGFLCAWFITFGLRDSATSPDIGEADLVVLQCRFYSAPTQ